MGLEGGGRGEIGHHGESPSAVHDAVITRTDYDMQLDHPIQSLHHVPHHRAVVFCVHANGHLTALDAALQTRPIHLPSTLSHVIAAQVLGEVVGNAVRIALLDKHGEFSVVEVDVSGPREMNGQIVKRGNLLEDLKNAQIDRAEISTDGTINATVSG